MKGERAKYRSGLRMTGAKGSESCTEGAGKGSGEGARARSAGGGKDHGKWAVSSCWSVVSRGRRLGLGD